MGIYRTQLPQLDGGVFLTDGGIETTLIFHEGFELPYFAAFELLKTPQGRDALTHYFVTYVKLAGLFDTGFILESPTWRASSDWGALLGYTKETLAQANREAIALLEVIREAHSGRLPVVVSGCIGPRFDGYLPDKSMTAEDARHYHSIQIETLASTSADMICALTLNRVEEAIGIVEAAREAAMPVVISFTLETDGRLPTGQSLGDAVVQVDEATAGYAAYFMINCAHPSHLETVPQDAPWLARVKGFRANASSLSHAELNDATTLDDGDPHQLGQQYASLMSTRLKGLNVLGGCCGTDHRHLEQIAKACIKPR
ncbi:homocysteine S-methyltransferase family protein [Shewanella amazonensis]|uniref:Homocysteine S-methyltransferase n=1 Tax=Shewanella amazonensis (strain ATCC BAA-1098 / SB2B) TaxID=326297 RepID=A1S2M1_SHEAM|nr:homocysteine S-methyltransferase family protein [Shewanella amazonensis]ABL98627.1 homocysteine S-methyltransferase [Shewanella amazonensis SB2B]